MLTPKTTANKTSMQILSRKAGNLQYILVIIFNNKNTTGRKFAKIKMGIFIFFSTKAMQI